MRRPDWEQRMRAAIARAEGQAFVYGAHDCCLFAADVVAAMTGQDYMQAFRGYHTRREVIQILRREGGMHPGITKMLGAPIAPDQARTGDVVAFSHHAIGIVCSQFLAAVATNAGGVKFLPRAYWRAAWRVV